MVVENMCGGEGVCGYGTGMWSCMSIYLRYTVERGYFVVRWKVYNVNCTFFLLVTKFRNKREVLCTI